MKMIIDFRELDVMNISHLQALCDDEEVRERFTAISGVEHYRLLSFLSTFYQNKKFIVFGLDSIESSIALTYNQTNHVYCFDMATNYANGKPDNKGLPLHFEIINESFLEYSNLILSSSIILIEEPWLGTQGLQQLFTLLKDNNYKGIVLIDNLYSFPETKEFWNTITLSKIILSRYGHWSGTGLVDFSGEIEFDVSSGGLHNNG